MKKGLSELVFIIDKSGSMAGLESDTIGGFNRVLKENREAKGEAIVSTVFFNQDSEVVHDRADIREVEPLSEKTYRVGGCTALLDAVGGSIRHIARVQRYMPDEHKAEHVIFVILTDGQENASRRYGYAQVKHMIEEKREQGWEFIFLGANIDVAAEAERLGMLRANVSNYMSDEMGTEIAYEAVARGVGSIRSNGQLDLGWNAAAEADVAARGF